MQDLNTRMDVLELKIQKLLQKMNRLQGENQELVIENNKLKKELQEVNIKLSNNNSPETVGNGKSDEELLRIKNELNQYIEEVEECINMLES
jgi:regulator of replication initiation timing